MENEEGTTQVATAEQSTDGGSVDQTSYVNDAWDKGYFRSHEAELNPNAATKAEPPKAPEQKQAETPKDQNAQQKQPDKQVPQKSRFETAFSGDDGEMDIDKFMKFSLPEMKIEPVQFKKADPSQPAAPEKPVWERDAEEVKTLSEKLRAERLDPLQKAADLIVQGMKPMAALNQIYLERQAEIDKAVNEEKTKREFQRQKDLEDRLTEKTRSAETDATIKVNSNEIISSLPGNTPEEKESLFIELFFSDAIGGEFLEKDFKKAYPDHQKMTAEQQKAARVKLVNSILSDKAELRSRFNQCLYKATYINREKLLAKARMSALAADKANRLSAQKGPVSSQPRSLPAAPGNKGQWNNYMTHHEQAVDRV
jgi:hypothetical protein